MKFEQVLNDFKKGSFIRRKCWDSQQMIHISSSVTLGNLDFMADDWEVVKLKFHDAVNALIAGKSIRRLSSGNSVSNSICLRHGKLYIGLGTCEVSDYKFNETDIKSQDWIIEG